MLLLKVLEITAKCSELTPYCLIKKGALKLTLSSVYIMGEIHLSKNFFFVLDLRFHNNSNCNIYNYNDPAAIHHGPLWQTTT